MANELNIQLDPFNQTGLVLLGKVFDKDGTQQGASTTLTENAPALYSGDFSLASISDDAYLVRFETNLPDELYGTGALYVRNNAEVSQENFFIATLDVVVTDTASRDASKADVSGIETKTEADARQVILISEHNQTQTDISNLNDFDPANDDVAKVNLVDVTTTNSDMRGTDNSNTVAPDNSGITQIQTDISNLNDISASDVYAEFISGTNENAFKADVSGLSTFDPNTEDVNTNAASRDASKADLSAIETKAQADTRQNAIITENNQTQVDISNLNNISTTDVQGALTSQGYTTSRSANLDNLDTTVSSRNSDSSATTRQTELINEHNATQSDISNLNNISSTDVQNALTTQGYTTTRSNSLDNLDATISSRATQSSVDDIPDDVDTKLTVVHGVGSWQQGSSSGTVDANIISVDGNNVNGVNDFKADVSGLSTFDASNDDVNTNTASRNASKADVSNLSTFDPSFDDVTTDVASREASKADVTDLATKDNQEVVNDGVKKASLLIPHSDNLPD